MIEIIIFISFLVVFLVFFLFKRSDNERFKTFDDIDEIIRHNDNVIKNKFK